MANPEILEPLVEAIKTALDFRDKELISRQSWGSITFDKAKDDLERIFTIIAHLRILPLEILPDQAVNQIAAQLTQIISHLKAIDGFSIEQANPPQTRDSLVTNTHARADEFYTIATPWIPFLAYQKGDVSRNIEALTKSVTEANTIVEHAKTDIDEKNKEIERIVVSAREASAAAGAAVFTQDFSNEAANAKKAATSWLWATAIMAIVTLTAAGVMWATAEAGLDHSKLIEQSGAKLVLLAVLFTATVWCGRLYRALMHQSTINRHRALGLQTFQAFSSAAADIQTKDAVLMETTRAIFANSATGFLDAKSGGQDQEIRVIEMAGSSAVARAVHEGIRTASPG